MKLYYSTNTSAMSCLVAVEELGIKCELVEVSWSKNQNVMELERSNSLGAVPTLVLDDGRVLTQNSAILEYLAEGVSKGSTLLPAPGKYERTNVLRWLAFVAADLHKAFIPALFAEKMVTDPKAQKQIEEYAKGDILAYLKHLEANMGGREFIAGPEFSIADCYLTVVLGWCEWLDISLANFPNVANYFKRSSERPAVKRALSRQ